MVARFTVTRAAVDDVFEQGYGRLRGSAATGELLKSVFRCALRFFHQPLEEKLRDRLPQETGYRGFGQEYSGSPVYPDQIESFTYCARVTTNASTVLGAELQQTMSPVFQLAEAAVEGLTKACAEACDRRIDSNLFNGGLRYWSRLQINFSRPIKVDGRAYASQYENHRDRRRDPRIAFCPNGRRRRSVGNTTFDVHSPFNRRNADGIVPFNALTDNQVRDSDKARGDIMILTEDDAAEVLRVVLQLLEKIGAREILEGINESRRLGIEEPLDEPKTIELKQVGRTRRRPPSSIELLGACFETLHQRLIVLPRIGAKLHKMAGEKDVQWRVDTEFVSTDRVPEQRLSDLNPAGAEIVMSDFAAVLRSIQNLPSRGTVINGERTATE